MVQLLNISLAFGGQQVLDGITWTIKPGQRIGIIGPNGAGKTTLLRIISGQYTPDAGTVSMSGTTTVGYLEQDVQEVPSQASVLEEALRAFDRVLALEADEHRITTALDEMQDHTTDVYLKLLHELDDVHAELVRLEAHRIRPKTEEVLSGLGFSAEDMTRPLATFSGGWRMRVSLARLLLRQPDYLLLDEPTNHLDIDSIDWLEGYLKAYQGTVAIVSHDRYFLDRMVNHTAELAGGHLTEYAGNYNYYLTAREERRALQQAAYDNQQKQIADTERFIERFRYKATKATQVQSRVKSLDKLERVAPPPTEAASISFRFAEPTRSGRTVIELSKFSKTYSTKEGDVHVFDGAGPVTIERGAKIALIGKNGAGKSTLARMIYGTEPFDGTRTVGYNVEPTFFAQHQAEALDPKDTILDSLRAIAQGQSDTEIRSLLGAFLFTGDDVFKPIGVLSGGEKSRVALARTLLKPANFLVLDEPTNHLDIQSINVLIEAMRQYTGTFVVVSHDRHFLDQVVNQVWRVEDGMVRIYIGNFSDYLWQVQNGTAARLSSNGDATVAKPVAEKASSGYKTKEQKRLEAEERNRRYREGLSSGGGDGAALTPAQLKKRYSALEEHILKEEERQAALEAAMADPSLYADAERARQTRADYEAVKAGLAALYQEWEQIAEQLATLGA